MVLIEDVFGRSNGGEDRRTREIVVMVQLGCVVIVLLVVAIAVMMTRFRELGWLYCSLIVVELLKPMVMVFFSIFAAASGVNDFDGR